MGTDRAPIWPGGLVGSISHCDDFVMAVVCSRAALTTIGIDCERRTRLDPGLSTIICRDDEQAWQEDCKLSYGEWLTAVFSTKEAVFKAHYAVERHMLGFKDIRIYFESDLTGFTADVEFGRGENIHFQNGIMYFDDRRIYTAAWLTA